MANDAKDDMTCETLLTIEKAGDDDFNGPTCVQDIRYLPDSLSQ